MGGAASCELCSEPGGELVYRHARYRVIFAEEPDYPGFCRVVWGEHVHDMTDLPAAARDELMGAVWTVEQAVREVMRPDKVNLASLGNMVPHLHWHVIPRYRDDMHFPAPVWAAPKRARDAAALARRAALLPALRAALARQLSRTA